MKYLILLTLLASGCAKNLIPQHLLIIGDSISVGYTPYVVENLEGRFASAKRITISKESTWPENARNSNFTRANISKWIEDNPKTNVVTWNNGIWDSTRPDQEQFYPEYGTDHYNTTLEKYEENLIAIATFLKSKNIRVLFFTTTELKPLTWGLFQQGIEKKRNAIAKRVLPGLGVEVYDLYQVSLTTEHVNDGDVHYTESGSKILGDFVTKCILGE